MPEKSSTSSPSINTSTTATTASTTTSNTTNSNNNHSPSSVLIGLQIKSLEQRTHSVTLPRNSSVLELKNEIQATLDVDSGRQRLIFQGKVLKDDKNLMDYANLDDGKVIHLVIRPLDAPQNPMNDEPRPANRRIFGNRNRPFPSIASRLPLMEGYTFITLDAHIGDPADHGSFLSSIMNGLAGANPFSGTQNGRNTRSTTGSNTTSNNANNGRHQTSTTTSIFPSFLTRSPFEIRRSLDNASNRNGNNNNDNNNTNNINNNQSTTNTSSESRQSMQPPRLPFPSSVEMRLARTMAYIRNVRSILSAPLEQQMNQIPYTSASSPDFIQEIRTTLRGDGNNSQTTQVGMVMNELANLMEQGTPWLRETARTLQDEGSATGHEENAALFRRVLRAARVIQGISLINHFLGSVLANAEMDGRRGRNQESTSSSPIFNSPAFESWLTPDTSRNNISSSTTSTEDTRMENSTEEGPSTNGTSQRGIKRKRENEDEATDNKEHGKGKGKETKDKTE
ncbi:uncharacterized protein BX664DRAFT_381408 [Halteromyces radiatus]|uniref:uncharacterized protein n=1 Tax=Halteromyces radiatus TaxID=101107 RepID=UPI00221F57B0|nr:uncharacterized protein BX664DRAFT_381408 [Halteromyces radiatus]KAI8098732.1 hypothetical protein BX664DRAFT_381408 [Halteromyces radiatus]